MTIWALSDLHLAISTPGKEMDFFGGAWKDYTQKIEENWTHTIRPDDLVLIAGDISWAMKLQQACIDLAWIDKLPGTKVMIRGNHDLWWGSISQVRAALPPSLHVIQNDIFVWKGTEIGGARLWDTPEYNYGRFITMKPNPRATKKEDFDQTEKERQKELDEAEKIFERELARLETSLKLFSPSAKQRLVMTHYPPIGADLAPSRASAILEKYKADHCIFGHLHELTPGALANEALSKGSASLGSARGVTYHLTSADYLNFKPLLISE